MLNRAAISLIRLYQRRCSPRLSAAGNRCWHYPSCSEYAVLAYRKHRFLTATRMALDRIRDCGREDARPVVDFP